MSKRMDDLRSKIDQKQVYSLEEAVKLAKETSNVKFDASMEIHANLGINPKKTDQQVRSTTILPHGTGKTKKIAVFASPAKEKEAKESGADMVLGEEEINQIKTSGKIDFDIAVTTPDMMPKIAVIAKILGPRGLMPNPKTDTVGPNIKQMVEGLKQGKINFKNDDGGNIHQIVGKVSFDDKKLVENITAFYEALKKAKPAAAKGAYIKSMTLTTTMGPAVRISTQL